MTGTRPRSSWRRAVLSGFPLIALLLASPVRASDERAVKAELTRRATRATRLISQVHSLNQRLNERIPDIAARWHLYLPEKLRDGRDPEAVKNHIRGRMKRFHPDLLERRFQRLLGEMSPEGRRAGLAEIPAAALGPLSKVFLQSGHDLHSQIKELGQSAVKAYGVAKDDGFDPRRAARRPQRSYGGAPVAGWSGVGDPFSAAIAAGMAGYQLWHAWWTAMMSPWGAPQQQPGQQSHKLGPLS